MNASSERPSGDAGKWSPRAQAYLDLTLIAIALSGLAILAAATPRPQPSWAKITVEFLATFILICLWHLGIQARQVMRRRGSISTTSNDR